MTKSTSQVLQEARALVAQGWCQGGYSLRQDTYCIVGALKHLERTQNLPRELVMSVVKALVNALPANRSPATWCRLVHFNDQTRTTKRRVLALFDRALEEVTK